MPYAKDGQFFTYQADADARNLVLAKLKTSSNRRQLTIKVVEPKIELYFVSADRDEEIDVTLSVADAMALYNKLSSAIEKLGEMSSRRSDAS